MFAPLTNGELTYTFDRQPDGILITRWAGDQWLIRHAADIDEALDTYRRLRRQGYHRAPTTREDPYARPRMAPGL
jgi:hypothetical protein